MSALATAFASCLAVEKTSIQVQHMNNYRTAFLSFSWRCFNGIHLQMIRMVFRIRMSNWWYVTGSACIIINANPTWLKTFCKNCKMFCEPILWNCIPFTQDLSHMSIFIFCLFHCCICTSIPQRFQRDCSQRQGCVICPCTVQGLEFVRVCPPKLAWKTSCRIANSRSFNGDIRQFK